MPLGKTEEGTEAAGAIIMIYYQNKFLMGQETSYVTDNVPVNNHYRTNANETIGEAFLYPGSTANLEELTKAKAKFSKLSI